MKLKVIEFENNEVEIYITSNKKVNRSVQKTKYNEDEYKEYRKKYILKRINLLKKIIKQKGDFFKYFLTLTFADQEKYKDFKAAYNEFRKFYKRVKSKYNFSYIMVPEKTLNGVYHFHIITNLELEKYNKNDDRVNININNDNDAWGNYWKLGFLNLKKIRNNKELINYLIKYMFKSDRKRLYYASYDIKLQHITQKFFKFTTIEIIFNILQMKIKEFYIYIRAKIKDYFSYLCYFYSNNANFLYAS